MTEVAIALGSNDGDRLSHLREAVTDLARLGEIKGISSVYETEPIGGPEQGWFLNAVVVLRTELAPNGLLEELHQIEQAQGRVREERWGPRTLDLDIVSYGDHTISEPQLRIPHPRAAERRFVLEPLTELWPEAPVGGGLSASEALSRVRDQRVRRWHGEWTSEPPRLGPAARWWVGGQLLAFLAYALALVLGGALAAPSWRWAVGGIFTASGALQAVWAVLSLGRELTPYPEPRPGGQLVDRGAYRLVRHPIYGGILLGFTGVAVFLGAWLALAVVLVLAGYLRLKAQVEERALALNVPGYQRYLDRVSHRFIPLLW